MTQYLTVTIVRAEEHQVSDVLQAAHTFAHQKTSYQEYCEAMQRNNEALAAADEAIMGLVARCRREARHKCYWMAATVFCVMVIAWMALYIAYSWR